MKSLTKLWRAPLLGLFLSAAAAADLTLKNGTVLKDYSVLRQSVEGLHIAHAEGVTKVPAANLPDDLREKYQWNAEAMEKMKVVRAVQETAGAGAAQAEARLQLHKELRAEFLIRAEKDAKKAALAEGVPCGSFKVGLVWAKPGAVPGLRGAQQPGHIYKVMVRNDTGSELKADFWGSVFLRGVADQQSGAALTLAPGEARTFEVKSMFSPGPNTQVSIQYFGNKKPGPSVSLRAPATAAWRSLADAADEKWRTGMTRINPEWREAEADRDSLKNIERLAERELQGK